MIKKDYIFRLGLAAALLGASLMCGSCGNNANSDNSQTSGSTDSLSGTDATIVTEPQANNEIPVGQFAEFKVKVADLDEFFNTCPDKVTLIMEDYNHTEVMMAIHNSGKKVRLVIPAGVKELAWDYAKRLSQK